MADQPSKPETIHFGLVILYVISFVVVAFFIARHRPDALLVFALLFGVPATIHFVVGRGVKQRKEWARVMSMVIGILMLFGFPVGTILGGFLIYRTSKGNWDKLLSAEHSAG